MQIFSFGDDQEGHFQAILGSCRVQKSSWGLSESFVCIGSRFNHFDSPHFGGFCEAFRAGFGDIFLTILDLLKQDFTCLCHDFLMDFIPSGQAKVSKFDGR